MMSAIAAPALLQPRPNPHRWTVPEFHRLCTLGLFSGQRPILLNGVILEQGPMDSPHGNGVERTDAVIRAAFGNGWRFRIQLPLVLSQYTDPVPDISVIAGALVGSPGHPSTATLVIDLTEKAELYATAGIADYWVLDLNGRQLHVFRDPQPLPTGLGATAYRKHQTLGPTESVTPLAAPTATIRVADLLP